MSQGYVEIENSTYYLDTTSGLHRDKAKTVCESVNMTMINFGNDGEKWQTVFKWVSENGKVLIIRHATTHKLNHNFRGFRLWE